MKRMFLLILLLVLFSVQPVTGESCIDNGGCPEGSFCHKAVGDCYGTGVCEPRPGLCFDLWDPVCGCDGMTYSNECYAYRAGVNVAYPGVCITLTCNDNNDCGSSLYYCKKADGDCEGTGVCELRPEFCPTLWAPVCGCDGNTYSNFCVAAIAGVNVDYSGECIPPGPVIVMIEPKTQSDDVHTGQSGINQVRILWSEDILFDANDIIINDENNNLVGFTASGSGEAIMKIVFDDTLLYDIYVIEIADTAVGEISGNPIDGDEDGKAGGNAYIIMEHRRRGDFDNNDVINFKDLAFFANDWLNEY